MKKFKDYHFFSKNILKAIEHVGFKNPTPIQEKVIPFLFHSKQDLIALAHTGTGKTAAFGLPIIQNINIKIEYPQALILCPTRELSLQITNDLQIFSKFIKFIKIISLYGGTNIINQLKHLKTRHHIIVGTPGRIWDLIKRKKIFLSQIRYFVLDEADEMMSMGFKDILDCIIKKLPDKKQNLLFSATMSKYIHLITNNYLKNPKKIITTTHNNISFNKTKHIYYVVNNVKKKYLVLKRILDVNPNIYGIIFCSTKKETKKVAELLIKDSYNADFLSGDLPQTQRENVLNKFRNKNLQCLVATDIASRGLDINNVTHVIHYDLPKISEIYIHRSGRTGRAGNGGTSICIIHHNEKKVLKKIEKKIGTNFNYILIPIKKEIVHKQILYFIKKIKNMIIDEKSMIDFMPELQKKLSFLDKNELIKRFSWIEFHRLINFYKNSKDLNHKFTFNQSKRKKKKNFYPKYKT
ncbi:DEAD/DEAH box helicase [Blattabacterium cuenoti]|uniref:DEAD/DEAH box helicase n=1 Tax=Blattabacterium cuenoti TaxID=1653831 RepID=UPI00163C457D|nr:DEAD/DEAH box helicase [Blattabacterium cuenoti]